jgi:hypothetical protein
MKCPDKDLTDGLHDMWEDLDKKERDSTKRLCSKCGSEMEHIGLCYCEHTPPHESWVCKNTECGHEEKLTEKELRGYETCNCVGCM